MTHILFCNLCFIFLEDLPIYLKSKSESEGGGERCFRLLVHSRLRPRVESFTCCPVLVTGVLQVGQPVLLSPGQQIRIGTPKTCPTPIQDASITGGGLRCYDTVPPPEQVRLLLGKITGRCIIWNLLLNSSKNSLFHMPFLGYQS